VKMEENNVTGKSGKQYFIELNKTGDCKGCPFLRSCWTDEEYDGLS
jgi:hypothetical protein